MRGSPYVGSLHGEYQRLPLRHSGLVCLPAAGNRNGTGFNNVGSNGNYWSSTPNGASNAYNLNFNSGSVNMNNNNRNNGFTVRLVALSSALLLADSKSSSS